MSKPAGGVLGRAASRLQRKASAFLPVAALTLWSTAAAAQGDAEAPDGATPQFAAEDTPDDGGGSITLTWPAVPGATAYEVSWATDREGPWTPVGEYTPEVTDGTFEQAEEGQAYFFRIAVRGAAAIRPDTAGPVEATAQWFNLRKLPLFILGAVMCAFVIYYIRHARKGGKLFIRKIAGLDAIDEAIGRSVEMGRPILFVPGINDLNDVQTLAGLTLLGHVARYTAEYDTQLNVPVCRSLVMTAGREVIQQAYLEVGRPDAYNDHMVHYLTDEQFAYVAGVNGIIMRDKPATCFYQGAFYAESLILSETGNAAGAIQIAGTANSHQLPFFVAACDYTLIGEELFAASAYLSNDPQQLGSLKGQDAGKLIAMVTIALGALVATGVALGGEGSLLSKVLNPVLDLLHNIFRH